ncbi:MAG: shikimate dehydrogenase [Candidatus Bathyarchaeota archaeon]|nr:shikimate dehydrogenase [Candidatus Bathyarchaeota archaeon]
MKKEIDGKTKTIGIIGGNIENSLSPFLHNELLKVYSLNYRYLPFQISENQIQIVIKWIRALNIKEMNVTAPFKEKLIAFIDNIEKSALRIGAMNTIINKNGILWGYNTDLIGFKRSLKEEGKIDINGKSAVILGAGGAARAIIYVLCEENIKEISIFNRTLDRAKKIQKEYRTFFPNCLIQVFSLEDRIMQDKINKTNLLINTTLLGAFPYFDINPLPENIILPDSIIVYDLIYHPAKTLFLRKAEKAGAKIMNGGLMLVYQAVESFSLWTGIKPGQKAISKLIRKMNEEKCL